MIKAISLTKVFRTESVETTALNGINLEINEGEFLAIMGPSGCGKSTLLNLLGLLDNPTDGELWFLGQEVSQYTENSRTDLRNGNIGFVFQSFHLINSLNVLDNVELPLLYRNSTAKSRREAAVKVLEKVGLSHRMRHFPTQLSGGQCQRVALARAIVGNPQIILADEPTGNLDSRTSSDVLGLLKVTSQKFHQTIVMITHNNEIAQLAGCIIRIEDGRISK